MSRDGEFRRDLFHRLSVFRLTLPPLRDIKEDIEQLLPLLVAEFNAKSGRQVRHISEEVWTQMRNHDWPGNVRELRNVVERCVLFSDGTNFPVQWLQLPGQQSTVALQSRHDDEDGVFIPLDGSMNLDDMDRHIIETTLERTGHNTLAAARALGTSRETLRYRIRKYGIKTPDR